MLWYYYIFTSQKSTDISIVHITIKPHINMDDILPTIPENTSLDSKLVLNLDAEFVSPIANNGDILSTGKYPIFWWKVESY